jgi:hypothetical protein
MPGFLWNALEAAEAHHANAVERRNRGRGGSTVTVYKTARAMYAARGGDTRTDGAKIADSVRELWARMRDDAMWNFRTTAELEPMEDIPW